MNSLEIYVPGEIYKNINKMLAYRGVTLKDKVLSESEITQQLQHYEYIQIQGERELRNSDYVVNERITDKGKIDITILMIAPGSKYATITQFFKQLIATVIQKGKIPKNGLDLMIVSENVLTVHLLKQIKMMRRQYPGLYIEHYNYNKFIIEFPKHQLVQPHEIANMEEVNEYCDNNYLTIDRFPKIFTNDTPVVWIGAKPGEVVKVTRLSENAGEAIAYRFVIAAP